MITTITLNPSVDRRYQLPDLVKGTVARSTFDSWTPGGKGLNVSRVAHQLGEEVNATGFLGGFTGDAIKEKILKLGIHNFFINIDGETRTCLALLTEDGIQTEILPTGPQITPENWKCFLDHLPYLIQDSQVLTASGSLPPGLPHGAYGEIAKLATTYHIPFILDTSGDALKSALPFKPFAIKPNQEELTNLLELSLESDESYQKGLSSLWKNYKIPLILLTLGGDGALISWQGELYRGILPKGLAIKNPIGSGDSTVAGIATGLARKMPIQDILKLGLACGTANALEGETGLINPKTVTELHSQIQIIKL